MHELEASVKELDGGSVPTQLTAEKERTNDK